MIKVWTLVAPAPLMPVQDHQNPQTSVAHDIGCCACEANPFIYCTSVLVNMGYQLIGSRISCSFKTWHWNKVWLAWGLWQLFWYHTCILNPIDFLHLASSFSQMDFVNFRLWLNPNFVNLYIYNFHDDFHISIWVTGEAVCGTLSHRNTVFVCCIVV